VNMKTGEPVGSSRRAGSSSRQGVVGCQETQEEEEGSCSALDFKSLILIYLFDNIIK
jgi:hypothetical protein